MNKWIKISERLPRKGQDVLAFCGWHITATYYHGDMGVAVPKGGTAK